MSVVVYLQPFRIGLLDTIANVYKLPSAEKTIWYLHACAGFPTKKYWLKAIKGGNYATWHKLTTESVNQHLPE